MKNSPTFCTMVYSALSQGNICHHLASPALGRPEESLRLTSAWLGTGVCVDCGRRSQRRGGMPSEPGTHVCPSPRAAAAKHHRRGGLKQWEVGSFCEGPRGSLFYASVLASGGSGESWTCLGLWKHHSQLCLHLLMASVSLCVSPLLMRTPLIGHRAHHDAV